MIKIPQWKVYFAIIVCVAGLIYAAPNILPDSLYTHLPDWWPNKKINLGLDLQGGSQLILEVDTKAGMKDRMGILLDEVRKILRKKKIKYLDLKIKDIGIAFKLRNAEDREEVASLLRSMEKGLKVSGKSDEIHLMYSEKEWHQRKLALVQQSREIVERRINEFGLAEPNIQTQGDKRILVQLPGVGDPTRIKKLLGKTAKMTFHLVSEDGAGKDVIWLPTRDREDSGASEKLSVFRTPLLDGSNLVDAQPGFNDKNMPMVSFRFDSVGARKFAEITRNNINKRFAIVLDGQIITAPVIRGVIPSGSGIIEGQFTLKQAQDLSLLMRAGALPAPLIPIEERTVGPDLGSDSIHAGQIATVTSIILVALFMLLAYMFFGIIANIGLVFNIILLVGATSGLGATLTLAGIAGIALTIGMAVDANILIYERIKEELRLGRSISSAIEAGYERAMTTIIDSNLTTLIAAAVLFYFGTGPIRGFAITLSLGIIISMFTAITLTRVLVGWWINWRKPKELSI